ncbi:RagB/SusD family nutrient uptake outer membrane protein [Parabacteroides gordonii]|uniref:RagB/SusD domain-containing protein n=1 Tax=Parabacteroides gordonii MS-1 = DSM 23371 TaxID=1203610 RepID=A0A0F5JLP8_9BACT|nr:RagB/SusD family nutrient uptake outer membrane protein [Parabacteroides gordonii]KKB58510.1 hypothetical protein HMPREF1536_01387 [Parabacteroides gordonii MS-1 = DSM 23371]MCA5583229.1 RagB/SusD family nutrient uptake outer membrane protein [Parabacteroides gordonii]
MNKIAKLSIFLFSACCISCSDFLDVEPLDSFTGEAVFSDPSLTEAYVNERYMGLRDYFGPESTVGLKYQASTRFICDESMSNFNWASAWSYNQGEVTPDQVGSYNVWKEYFTGIKDCNIFFENIELLQNQEELVNRLTGEVTFLRAYLYAELVNRYGGVPIITKTFGINDDMMVTRDSYEDCISFIVTELDKAASLLPVKQEDKNFGRATKGAALALKSRMLLYAASPQWNSSGDTQKWKAAADAAKAVIDLTDNSGSLAYELDPSYKDLFLTSKSKEIIFMRLYSSEYGHRFDWENSPNGFTGWSATCPLQDMVDSYEMEDGSMPTPDLYKTDEPWKGREPRFYHSILCDGQEFRGREIEFWTTSDPEGVNGVDTEYGPEGWNTSKTRYTIRKFMNEALTAAWVDKGTQPFIFSRLGEIYLNYAEAMFHLGDEATARKYVNLIRERAREGKDVLPDITSSGDELLKKIQHERKIELAFEEHRYYDVRRWKIAEQTENKVERRVHIVKDLATGKKTYSFVDVQERKFLPQHYLMPIPRSEIQKNPLLEQNPYYN